MSFNSENVSARSLFLLSTMAIVGQLSTNIYMPAIPSMSIYLSVPSGWVQLSVVFYLISMSFGQLISGPIIDKINLKIMVYFSIAIFILGTIICIISTSIWPLCVGRMIQGCGAAPLLVMSRAIARNKFEGNQLTIAMTAISISLALVPGLSPALGGYFVKNIGWQFNFCFMIVVSLIFLIVSIGYDFGIIVKEEKSIAIYFIRYTNIIKNRVFIGNTMISSIQTASIFSIITAMPSYAIKNLQSNAIEFGIYAALISVGFFVGSIFAVGLIRRISDFVIYLISITVQIAMSFILIYYSSFGSSLMIFSLLLFMYFFGVSLTYSISTIDALKNYKDHAIFASSIFGFTQLLLGILGIIADVVMKYIGVATGFIYVMIAASILAVPARAFARPDQ